MELALDSRDALNQFLAGVERRAFRIAKFSSGGADEAFDLVQEAMLQFVKRYADRPRDQWNALFYRVLKSRITDWHRRTLVRRRFLAFLGLGNDEREGDDLIRNLPDLSNPNPSDQVERQEERSALDKAIRKLPLRQQQAFLLRAWEGMDVAQTSLAMGCSEGSVKTHYSRAVHTLRGLLEDIRS